jgi:hypothetical protein
MNKGYSKDDQILGKKELLEKWIKKKKRKKHWVNITDIQIKESIHKRKFTKKIPEDLKEVTQIIYIRPDLQEQGKYVLVIGWKSYHYARAIGQEKIRAYYTPGKRKIFAKILSAD